MAELNPLADCGIGEAFESQEGEGAKGEKGKWEEKKSSRFAFPRFPAAAMNGSDWEDE
jgi:hypothetical protein